MFGLTGLLCRQICHFVSAPFTDYNLQLNWSPLLQCTEIGMAPTSHAVVKLSAQRCDGTFVIPL